MLKSSTLVLLTLASVASLPAQDWYVPNSDPSTGGCNVIPFGSTTLGTFAQARYQCKATAADLGGAVGVITGLGFAPCRSGTAHYTQIDIVMDHHPAGTPLTTTFANNLTPAAMTVMSASDFTWHLTADNWTEIGLQVPFVYNGIDDLVIQVTTVDGTAPGGFHRDARQRVYWVASSGTPAPSGASGNAALKFEVSMLTAKTSTYGVGCAGTNGEPVHSFGGSSQLGQTLDLEVSAGVPNQLAFLVMGIYAGTPFPLDLGFLGMPGCFQHIDTLTVLAVPLDPAGAGAAQLPIPNDPSYVNVRLYSQYACLDPGANAAGVTTTRYGRIYIGN
ncbi:MAG: hypothetical protein NXI31_26200 [bacterium]|nr:hypothetical protein [bacterium]